MKNHPQRSKRWCDASPSENDGHGGTKRQETGGQPTQTRNSALVILSPTVQASEFLKEKFEPLSKDFRESFQTPETSGDIGNARFSNIYE